MVVLFFDFILSFFIKARFYYVSRLPFGYNGLTFPPFGIYIVEKHRENEMLRRHELAHWEQYRGLGGLLFGILYAFQYVVYGYDRMPMEVEARRVSGEKESCIYNYTSCVRSGCALTIFNEDFRL